jgi:hypothetical protein
MTANKSSITGADGTNGMHLKRLPHTDMLHSSVRHLQALNMQHLQASDFITSSQQNLL